MSLQYFQLTPKCKCLSGQSCRLEMTLSRCYKFEMTSTLYLGQFLRFHYKFHSVPWLEIYYWQILQELLLFGSNQNFTRDTHILSILHDIFCVHLYFRADRSYRRHVQDWAANLYIIFCYCFPLMNPVNHILSWTFTGAPTNIKMFRFCYKTCLKEIFPNIWQK